MLLWCLQATHDPHTFEFEEGTLVLAFGNSTISKAAIDKQEMRALGSEVRGLLVCMSLIGVALRVMSCGTLLQGFVMKSSMHGPLPSLVVNGNPIVLHTRTSLDPNLVRRRFDSLFCIRFAPLTRNVLVACRAGPHRRCSRIVRAA